MIKEDNRKDFEEFAERAERLTGEKDWEFINWLYPTYIQKGGDMSDEYILGSWEGYLSGGLYDPTEGMAR